MGRPKTGRNSKLVRVPLDFDHLRAIELYYDVLPVIERWNDDLRSRDANAPRWENVSKMLDECGFSQYHESENRD